MKKSLSLIILLIFVFILSGCGLFSMDHYKFTYIMADKYSIGNAEIEEQIKLKSIHINWYAGEVFLNTHDKNTIIIEEEIEGSATDDQKVHYKYDVTSDESYILIQYGKSGLKEFDGIKKNLKVTVPQNDEYYLGGITHTANFNADFSTYDNCMEKISYTSDRGNINIKICDADEVFIAGGNSKDVKDGVSFNLEALEIASLGMNSSYASINVNAKYIRRIENFGSVFKDTNLTCDRIGTLDGSGVESTTTIKLGSFERITFEARDKAFNLYLGSDMKFKLKLKLHSAAGKNADDVIPVHISGFEYNKISDTEYDFGGSKELNITTMSDVYISVYE